MGRCRDNLGLAQGGRQIKACKEKFVIFLTNLIKLASLQTSFLTLDEALKVGGDGTDGLQARRRQRGRPAEGVVKSWR